MSDLRPRRLGDRINYNQLLILAAILVVALVILLSNPAITGRFFTPYEEFSQKVDKTFSESGTADFQIADLENFNLKSLKISGSYVGEGHAKVFLKTANGTFLVFDSDNLAKQESLGDLVTGFFTEITSSSSENKKDKSAESASPKSSESSDAQKDKKSDTTDSGDAGADKSKDKKDKEEKKETAQPGPPSSDKSEQSSDSPSEQSSPDSTQQGTGSDTTLGDPGAESPLASAPDELPAEQPAQEIPAEIPAENLPVEIPVEQLPEEIPLEENQTQEPSPEVPAENQTEEIVPENITEEILPEIKTIAFENECLDTCILPDGLNETSYTLEIEVESGTTLTIGSITYSLLEIESALPENLTLTNETLLNETLVNETLVNETLINQTVFFVTNILDSEDNKVDALVEFVDPQTEEVEAIGKSEKGDREATENDFIEEPVAEQPATTEEFTRGAETTPETTTPTTEISQVVEPAATAPGVIQETTGEPGLEIPEGKYKLKIKPQNHPIKEIVFDNLDVNQDVKEFVKIDDIPENATGLNLTADALEVYAIDPTGFNFTSATVTAIAKGNTLLKCKDWDFANQTCFGEWVFIESLTPGQAYTFTLAPNDPAFSDVQQPNSTEGKDARIKAASATSNFGTATTLTLDDESATKYERILIEFDVSGIPSDAVIKNATLELYQTANSGSAFTANVYRINSTYTWTESGVTWNSRNGTTNWVTAGGDYASTIYGNNTVDITINDWELWTITSLVQEWVNGTYPNYGMIILSTSNLGNDIKTFSSSDGTTASQRPKLTVNWTTALNFTFVNPTPADGSTVNITSVFVNVTLDGTATTAKLELNNANYTMNNYTAKPSSRWFLNQTGLANAVYTYKVFANDSGTGKFDASETRVVTVSVDNVPPYNVTFIAPTPANNSLITINSAIINVTVSDDGTVDSCKFEFDGVNSTMTKVGTGSTVTCNINKTSIADGTHTYKVHANDTTGKTNSSELRTLRADAAPPQIQFVALTDTTGSKVNRNYVLANVTATDASLANITIRLYNTTSLANAITTVTSPNYVNFTNLADGVYFINATAVDSGGSSNSTETRNITVDTTKPLIRFVSPTEADGAVLNRNNIRVNVTATDSNLANITIRLYNSTSLINTTSTTTSPNFITFVNLANGLYYFNATALDTAGNANSTATRNVTIDITAPAVTIILPQNVTYSTQTNLALNFTATDNNAISACWYSLDSGANTTLASCANTAFSVAADGSHNIRVYANDTANNLNSSIVYFAVDSIAPVINSISDSPDPVIQGDATDIEANITDANAVDTAIVKIDSTNYTMARGGTALNKSLDAIAEGGGNGWTDCTNWDTCIDTATLTSYGDGSTADKVTTTTNNRMLHTDIMQTGLPSGTKINWVEYVAVIASNTAASGQGFKWHATDCDGNHADLTGVVETNATFRKFSQQFNTTSGGNNWTVACLDGTFEPGVRAFGTTISGWEVDQFYVTVNYNINKSVNIFSYSKDTTGMTTGIHNYTVYANDTAGNNAAAQSSAFNVTGNNPPTHTTPKLNSTFGTNRSNENLTVYPQNTADADNDAVVNIFDWRMNSESLAVLNMPFEAGTTSTSATDFSAEMHDGTSSTISWSSTAGKVGGAYSYNSVDDEIEIMMEHAQEHLNFGMDMDFTLEAWVKTNSNSTRFVINKGNSTTISPAYYLSVSAGKAKAYISDATVNASVTSTATINNNAYHHLAAVYDRDQNLTLYVDGAKVATTPISSVGNITNSANFFIGSAGGRSYWFGEIDEVKVYMRALSVEQIRLHNATQYDVLSDKETAEESWTAKVTPSDGKDLGTGLESNSVTISKFATTAQLYLNGARANKTIIYSAQSNATATTSNLTVTLYRDGTTVTNPDVRVLPAGTYNYTAFNPGDADFSSSFETWFLTVSKQATAVALFMNGSQANLTITYSAQSNATAVGYNGTVTLYRDGTTVTNPDVRVLPAGTYNYTASIPEEQNKSSSFKTYFLTVNKASDTISLYLNSNLNQNVTITYGTASNATATSTTGTHLLFRDGVLVSNPEIATLAAGTYQYKANSTGNQNYSAGVQVNYLTVNKAASAANLLLNGADANITVNQSQTVNITGYLTTGQGTIAILQDGTQIASGASPLTNISVYATVGSRNITLFYSETQNYTSGFETHFVTVIDSVVPIVSLEAPANNSANGDNPVEFNFTVSDTDSGIARCDLYINSAYDQNDTTITESITQTFTKSGLATANYTWRVECLDNSQNSNKGVSETRSFRHSANAVDLVGPADQSVNRGVNATYNIVVRNTGQVSDNYTLTLENVDSADVVSLNQTTITGIPAGTNRTVLLRVTDNNGVGLFRVNVTAQSAGDASITDEIEISTTVLGTLSTTLRNPNGTPVPVYYQGQNIVFRGQVKDELNNAITGAAVTFEPANGSNTYICSTIVEEGSGNYNCTLNTALLAVPVYYNVRTNATKQYYNAGTSLNNTAFYLGYDVAANLTLTKLANVQSINNTHVVYNVTLELKTTKGNSDNTQLRDSEGSISSSEGTVGTAGIKRSYLLTYVRGSSDQTITLSKANASGYDPLYARNISAESNAPVIIIPQNITGAQLTIVKNIMYLSQTTTNITYAITDQIVNSGGQDLTGISVVDADIGLATIADLARGQTATYSGNMTLQKGAQNIQYDFDQVSAEVNSIFYDSNQPSILIPGYGGPYDVIIDGLPSSVLIRESITGTVKAINMNSEISEDRTLTTLIEDASGTVYDVDVRTIFVGRNQSATAQVTLTAPSTPGTYYFVSELTWPTAYANASKSFMVTVPSSSKKETAAGDAAGGGGAGNVTPITGAELPQVPGLQPPPTAELPYDITADLITLRTQYNKQAAELGELRAYIQNAEDAAALGKYDEARNWIRSAYAKLGEFRQSTGFREITPAFAFNLDIKKSGYAAPVVMSILIAILLIMQIARKREEDMRHYLEFLRYERKTLSRLEKYVDRRTKDISEKLDRAKERGHNL